MKFYGQVLAAVTELIVTILLFLFIGQYLDKNITGPKVYIIVATLVGAGLGFTRLVLKLKKVSDDENKG